MFSFSTTQQTFHMQGVKIGGQPGENPTVLMGTIFYVNQFKTFDAEARSKAERVLLKQEEMGDLTGNPAIADIFISKEEYIRTHIEFTLDHIPNEAPFAVDIPESEVRIAALKYLEESGLLNRTIYNSLNLGLTPDEQALLAENPPAGAILLGYNPKDLSTDGRVDIIETGAGMLEKGLMAYANEAHIHAKLLDTAAVPFGHNAAETIRAIPVMKNKWGMPVGCSFHNTVESWKWLKDYKQEHRTAYRICDIGSNGLVILFGASFVLYGPIESAPRAFPFVAMVDKIVSEGAEDYFGVVPEEGHPRTKLG